MPNYIYKCQNCKEEFDIVKGFKEINKIERCDCGAIAERMITVPGVVYKCGGFTQRPERDVDSEIKQIMDKEAPQNPFN